MAPTLDLVVAKSDSFHILKSGSTWTNISMNNVKIQFYSLQKNKSGQNVFLPELVCICTIAPHTVAAYTDEPEKKRFLFHTKQSSLMRENINFRDSKGFTNIHVKQLPLCFGNPVPHILTSEVCKCTWRQIYVTQQPLKWKDDGFDFNLSVFGKLNASLDHPESLYEYLLVELVNRNTVLIRWISFEVCPFSRRVF